jgi:hypothetical protein
MARRVARIAVGLDIGMIRDKQDPIIQFRKHAIYVACDDGTMFYRTLDDSHRIQHLPFQPSRRKRRPSRLW